MNSSKNQKICLKEFIPEKVICNNDVSKSYDLNIIDKVTNLKLFYYVPATNQFGTKARRCFTYNVPKFINRNSETFQVLGLLQAEMGKKMDGKITFCNNEYKIINKVIEWFEKELKFSKNIWKWYIKLNINKPIENNYKKEIESKVISYWLDKTKLDIERSYPTKVSYIKNTKNKILKEDDCGTLIIEKKINLISQIVKNLVKKITDNILNFEKCEIRNFMKGIIAGESCVEIHLPSKKFRVHISANDPIEKFIYSKCLYVLRVGNIIYKHDKLVISKKQNNLELLKQGLMSLSPKKHDKFLKMMNLYQDLDVSQYVK